MLDCFFDNCSVGVLMEGGHGAFDGLTFLNTPVAFDLRGGATIDARRIYHSPGPRRRPAA
jgi:hypothetical protein